VKTWYGNTDELGNQTSKEIGMEIKGEDKEVRDYQRKGCISS
jgi:hypothetical protein